MKKQKKKKSRTLTYVGGVVLLLLVILILSNQAKKQERQALDDLFDKEIILQVQDFSDQGAEHISESGQFTYNSNPPTSSG